ncbi:membrane protein insertion efficiency factor YidD [Patescibacteria group bacterium]
MVKKLVLSLIKIYQRTLSLDHGFLSYIFSERFCRFHPSCSQYTHEAVVRFGSVKGCWIGLKRVLRCHPWSDGGNDPVPEKK